jgi:chorismate mutase
MKEIDDWRERIDRIDSQLLWLLNRRARLAIEIAEWKRRMGLPLRSPRRELMILAQACRGNCGPLDSQAVSRLFRLVIRESRRVAEAAVEPVEAGAVLK